MQLKVRLRLLFLQLSQAELGRGAAWRVVSLVLLGRCRAGSHLLMESRSGLRMVSAVGQVGFLILLDATDTPRLRIAL